MSNGRADKASNAWDAESIAAFVATFEAGRLPKALWTHEAHLVVATYYLWSASPDESLRRLRKHIVKHNEAVGTPNDHESGYHETITRAWVAIVRDFLVRRRGGSIEDVLTALLMSDAADADTPLRFYSRERLFSSAARADRVTPDRQPLPGT